MKQLTNLIYGSTPAEFESQFDLSESVRRLRATTTSLYNLPVILLKQTAVGRVTARRVSLRRSIPLVGNSFKPFFFGSFKEIGGRVRLIGRFTLYPFVKVLMTCWFGGAVFWTVFATALAVVASVKGKASIGPGCNYWMFPPVGLGIFLVGVGFVLVCKWFARNDPRWLTSVIQNALGNNAASSASRKIPAGDRG